jgi:chromosome segregation ATPase
MLGNVFREAGGLEACMTNDEYGRLIEYIGRRFDEVDAKLAAHDDRFAQIDDRFGEVLGQIEHLYARFERLDQEYQAIVAALRRIEHKLDRETAQREALGMELSVLKGQVAALHSRIEELERRIA